MSAVLGAADHYPALRRERTPPMRASLRAMLKQADSRGVRGRVYLINCDATQQTAGEGMKTMCALLREREAAQRPAQLLSPHAFCVDRSCFESYRPEQG